jgi:hypothetical protein
MNGQAIGNATKQINMRAFMRRREKHLSHILIPTVVNATRKPHNNQLIEKS